MQGNEEDDLVEFLRNRPGQAGIIYCHKVSGIVCIPSNVSCRGQLFFCTATWLVHVP